MNLVEYRCRRCCRWLFSSDAEWGRLRLVCPNTRCREDQTIFLGGRRTVALHKGLAAPSPEQPQMRAPAEERREALLAGA